MTTEFDMTRDEAIQQVVAALEGAIPLDEVVNRVLEIWPSKAKTAKSNLRTALRLEYAGKSVIFLNDETLIPISIALNGVTFRVPVDRQFAEQGLLSVYPTFTCFLPSQVPPEAAKFVDTKEKPISATVRTQKQKTKSPLGSYSYEKSVFDLTDWCLQNDIKRGDSLLVIIQDWNEHLFRLVHERARITNKRRSEIQQRNQELSDLLFDMLESARDESLWSCAAVLTAYIRLSNPTGYPGDHWLEVIERDGRMRWDGYAIRYADYFTPFDLLVAGQEETPVRKSLVSAEQVRQVYSFKAELWHRKGLWRRIEIQGDQTLGDLDSMLRNAFRHDPDHMSGFWKRVRRGNTRRFREVNLGSLDPFGGGEAAEVVIAGLNLAPGDELKYVYDFGDWIEHRITLETIKEPDQTVTYPQVVEQNKPRYRYCQHCQKQGKNTVATWICIDCSNRKQRDVLVCEACLDSYHSEHYADEILY
jgi:hypothetical protein